VRDNLSVCIDHARGSDFTAVTLCGRHFDALTVATKDAERAALSFGEAMKAGFDARRNWEHEDFLRSQGYDEPVAYDQSRRETHPHPLSHPEHEAANILHDDCVECYPNSICHKCHHVQPCPLRCR